MVGGPVRTQNNKKTRYSPVKKPESEAKTRRVSQEKITSMAELVKEYSIYVFNLADDVKENQLWHLFGPFGAIKSIKIVRDATTNQSKGFGFVTMKNLDEAKNAIDILNGHTIKSRPMKVSFKGERSKSEDENPMGEPGAYQIYVFNLESNTIEDDLWKLFGQFGAVKNVTIVQDPKTKKSKGFAFITMKSLEEAQKAINTLNGFKLHGKSLMVSFKGQRPDEEMIGSDRNPDQIQSVPIYVNYLPHDVEDGTVWKLFSQFGAIKDVNIVRDPETKKCMGYAFVNMKSLEDATIAINSLDKFEMNGKRLHVSLKSKKIK